MSNRSKKTQIPNPKCPICHTPFNDQTNTPLLLQCGHTFCHQCLSQILSSSSSSSSTTTLTNQQQQQQQQPHSKSKPYLSCPKCRHVSPLGNSLLSLPKNFTLLLSLADVTLSSDSDDDDDDDDRRNNDDDEEEEEIDRGRGGTTSFCCLRGGSGLVDHELRVERERGVGVLVRGRGRGRGQCRHKVVVRRVESGDVAEIDWVERELENLRRRSMWCRNVCGFYGVVKRDDHLCIVLEKCFGSVESEMRRSGGRLTLDQILR